MCSYTIFWPENLKGKDYSEYLVVDGRIISGGSSRNSLKVVDWICLAQNRDRFQALVNTGMKFRLP